MMKHLSSERMDALMCGETDVAAAEHVAACEVCAGELAAMQRLMAGFRQSAVVVAEQQRLLARVQAPRQAGWFGSKAWVSCAAMVCALAWVAPIALHRHAATPVPAAVVAPAQPAGEALSDDELLAAVQNDLSDRVPVALQPLAVDANGKASKTQ